MGSIITIIGKWDVVENNWGNKMFNLDEEK